MTTKELERVAEEIRKNSRRVVQILVSSYDEVATYQIVSAAREKLAAQGERNLLEQFNRGLRLQKYRG